MFLNNKNIITLVVISVLMAGQVSFAAGGRGSLANGSSNGPSWDGAVATVKQKAQQIQNDYFTMDPQAAQDPRLSSPLYWTGQVGTTFVEVASLGYLGPKWLRQARKIRDAIEEVAIAQAEVTQKLKNLELEKAKAGPQLENQLVTEMKQLEEITATLEEQTVAGKIAASQNVLTEMYEKGVREMPKGQIKPGILLSPEVVFGKNTAALQAYLQKFEELETLMEMAKTTPDSQDILARIEHVKDVAAARASEIELHKNGTFNRNTPEVQRAEAQLESAEKLLLEKKSMLRLAAKGGPMVSGTNVFARSARGGMKLFTLAGMAYALGDIGIKAYEIWGYHEVPGINPLGEFAYTVIKSNIDLNKLEEMKAKISPFGN